MCKEDGVELGYNVDGDLEPPCKGIIGWAIYEGTEPFSLFLDS